MWLVDKRKIKWYVCVCVWEEEREEVNTYEQRDKMGDD